MPRPKTAGGAPRTAKAIKTPLPKLSRFRLLKQSDLVLCQCVFSLFLIVIEPWWILSGLGIILTVATLISAADAYEEIH